MARGKQYDVGRRDCEDGPDPGCVDAPRWKLMHVLVVAHGPEDSEQDADHHQTAPSEPTSDPPGDEIDERAQSKIEPEYCQEVWFPVDRHVPPSGVLADGYDTQREHTGNGSAGQGTRDAPSRRAREERDGDEDDQVQDVKEVELPRGHVFAPGRRTLRLTRLSGSGSGQMRLPMATSTSPVV